MQGSNPGSPALWADSFPAETPGKPHITIYCNQLEFIVASGPRDSPGKSTGVGCPW